MSFLFLICCQIFFLVMQETEPYSSKLDAEVPIGQSVEINNNLFKVHRKGDKIFHVDDEHVTMLNNVLPKSHSVNIADVDAVSSGESLYKTFSFDKALCEEETEKCIAFWRGVVEKNLEPIKCTLIEEVNEKTTPKNDPKKERKTTKKSRVKREEKAAEPRDNNIWFQILHELQSRKLHQTKLLMEERCQFCQYLKGEYETDDPQEEIKKQFKELDEWVPRNTKRRMSNGPVLSHGNNKDTEGRKQSSSSRRSTVVSVDGTVEEAKEVPGNIELLVSVVKEQAKLIEFVDAIEEKQKNGKYSEWRQNQLSGKCNCAQGGCGCNTNPAVIDARQRSLHASDSHGENNAPKGILNVTPKARSKHNRRTSVLVGCTCSKSSCDCHLSLHTLEKEVPTERDEREEPPAPVKRPADMMTRTNSLEIVRRRLSFNRNKSF